MKVRLGPSRIALLIAASLLVLAAAAGAEDLTVIYQVTNGKGDPIQSSQVVTSDRVRTSDGTTDTIFMIETGEMVLINHKKQEFYRTSIQEMQARFAEIDETLNSNPMMRRMLMGKSGEVKVEQGSSPRTIAGYYCDHWVITMGKNMRFEIWATPSLEAPRPYWDARKLSYASMGPVGSRFKAMVEAMEEIEGFPLASHVEARMMGIKSNSQSEAQDVMVGEVPADAFTIPAGYEEGDSPFAQ